MAENTMLQHNCAPVGCSICKIAQLEAEIEYLKQQILHYANWGAAKDLRRERVLADELAMAIRDHECFHEGLNPRLNARALRGLADALVRHEEARRG